MKAEIAKILRTTEANVAKRIVAMKLGPVCSRCGGSGRYSFNQVDGDRCYGCLGPGHVAPATPKEWELTKQAAIAAATDGTLDKYLAVIAARARCKNAMKRAFAAWHKMDALNGYGKTPLSVLMTLPDESLIRSRNKVGVDLIATLQKLDKGRHTDWLAYDAALSQGLARLAEITAELEKEKSGAC